MGSLADIATLITSEATKYIGDMPDAPDKLICLYRTSGYSPLLDLNKNAIEKPTFQVVVRDTSYILGDARCEVIKILLRAVTNVTINSTCYINILQTSDILDLGKDEKNRCLFSINFKVQLTK